MADINRTQFSPGGPDDEAYRLVLGDDAETWVFRWEPGCEHRLMSTVAEFAGDPSLSFDFFDAAVVCHCVLRLVAPPPPCGLRRDVAT